MDTTAPDTIEFKACTDCVMLIANGDTTGNSRCETEEGEAEYLAAVAANTDGLHLVVTSWDYDEQHVGDTEDGFIIPEGDEGSFRVDEDGLVYQVDWTEEDRYYGHDTVPRFTMSGCEVCGDGLGGDKHPVVGWRA